MKTVLPKAMPTQEEADKILGYLAWRVSKLWQRRMAKSLKSLGIGSTQFVVLGNTVRLSISGEAVNQRSLAEVTAIDAMTVSQTVRGLVDKGLIQYVPQTLDKRQRSVLPTAEGIRVLQSALKQVSEAHARFFRLESRDQEVLITLLQQLIKENSDEKPVA